MKQGKDFLKFLLGSASGKIGDVIFCNGRKRKPYMRKAPAPTQKEPSPAQQITRKKFALANKFIKHFRPFIALCWKPGYRTRKRPEELALSHLITSCMRGEHPDTIHIDYARVKLSEGNLSRLDKTSMSFNNNRFELNWIYPCHFYNNSPGDEVILIWYNEERQQGYIIRNNYRAGQLRIEEKIVHDSLPGKTQVWMILRSPDGKQASSTSYLGFFNNQSNS